MHELIRQLEGLARSARQMVVAQRLAQWIAAVIAALVVAGLIDFALRLPSGLRLTIGVAAAAGAMWWLWTRLARAWRFRPDLPTLALRAERLYPQLKDILASGVEFAAQPQEYADPQITAVFAQVAVHRADSSVKGVALRKLLDPTVTLRWTAVLIVAVLFGGGLLVAAPDTSMLALQRWFLPMGAAEWPKRVSIESMVDQAVWPTDTPLKIEASVSKGYYSGMRAWVHYRVRHANGNALGWNAVLMSDQAERARNAQTGRFERLIDLGELTGAGATQSAAESFTVELYMSAGDDHTATQAVQMVTRPAVRSVRAKIEPPAYAQGLVAPQQVALDEQTGPVATASALQGSAVELELSFNKPLPVGDVRAIVPGLPGVDADEREQTAAQLSRSFTLEKTLQTAIALTDEHGLSNISDRVYRIEAVEDKPPAASLVEPVADEAVLATAVVEIEAAAQDDVGVERVQLEVQAPVRDVATTQATINVFEAAEQEGRSARLRLTHALELASLKVQPGDEVTLTAVAQDVYAMSAPGSQDKRHDPVRSTPRKLHIIDVPTLVAQVRSELANVRQQAIRIESTQRELMEAEAAAAAVGQQQLDRRLDAQQKALRTLNDRLQRNRLDEPTLKQTMDRAGQLLEQADAASQQAAGSLQQSSQEQSQSKAQQKLQQGRAQQKQSRDALGELITLLDQGRDALTLQLQLRQMITQQEQLADDTRKLLPRTAGQRPEDLAPDDARQLEDVADRQQSMARQAEEMVRQMQATADAMQRQSESDQDQAAAQALREAASIAQRQGLSPQMDKAAQSTDQNKLSDAGQQQLGAIDTMQQMMGAMGSQEQKRMEMLRRRLAQLAELLRKLVDQQKVQLARLGQVQQLGGLDEGMSGLRRNTISVEAEARKSPQTTAAAEVIGKAATEQAAAIQGLRGERRADAELAERQSLAYLEEALRLIEQTRQKAEEQMTDQQRTELEEAYRKLAADQQALRKRTEALANLEKLDRRQRADVVQLGHEEADLQIAASELREKVEQTLVFLQSHRRIDESAARVARQLRGAQADSTVLFEQDMIAARLVAMADALQQPRNDDQFREDEQQQQAGGGGGGGPPPQLVPPVAELKLIRGMQDAIYHQTRSMDQLRATAPDAATIRSRLIDLSAQQRELSDLGTRLVEKVKNPMGAQE